MPLLIQTVMNTRSTVLAASLCAATFGTFAASAAQAQNSPEVAAQACVTYQNAQQRLACFDQAFAASAKPDTQIAPANTTEAAPDETPLHERITASDSAMSAFWELRPQDKRKRFVVRTYHPNYVLPLHVTSDINRRPYSPTRGYAPERPNYKGVEAKFQVSLRAKVLEDLLLPGADLWATYTQRSMWQVWNSKDSAPFRNTDYQPEIRYVLPVPTGLSKLPFGWTWRMADVGFAHQSNGQSEPLSRSWNRLYAGIGLEKGEVSLQMRFNRRPKEGSQDDNPDLTRYIGNTEMSLAWLPGRSTANLTWKLHPKSLKNGSLQLDWTYPVDSQHPEGLRWYLQIFTGYGETLLDYNHRQTSLGLGVTLFQF